MRNLKILTITLFLVLSIAFSVFFFYDQMITDHTPPVIYCTDESPVLSVNSTDREFCVGLTATDNVDGDITDRIIVRRVSQLVGVNYATVHYAVFDSSSNYCTFTRAIRYNDYSKPHFSLTQPLIYSVRSVISLEDRLTAADVIDGDISRRIRPFYSTLDNTEPGEYALSVQVTNSSGDTSIVSFVIMIRNTTARDPIIRLSEYLIYTQQFSKVTVDDLRSYIVTARESIGGNTVAPEDITITFDSPHDDLDTSVIGSQNVYFSYTNEAGLEYSVILTVVTE